MSLCPLAERDTLETGDMLPVAPFRLGHVSGAALVSRPSDADHAEQRSGLGLGEPQPLAGPPDFVGCRHGLILGRIRWKHKLLDTHVSIGYHYSVN